VWGEEDHGSARAPALDGLRGVAVAGVLLFHAGATGFDGGFLGVSIFFTLSGFLITSLLLVEHESTGRIGLGHFWARRARRILPAALLALAGVALYGLTVADAHQASRLPGDGLSALAEVANWRFVFGDQSYAALFSAPSPVQHFWSLAIEEQFYLVFPLVVFAVLALAHGRRRPLTSVVVTLAVASAALAAVMFSPGHDPSRVYYGTDTRAVELLVGALLAIALAGRRRLAGRTTQLAVAGIGTVALVALLVSWVTVEQGDGFLYRGGLATHALLAAAVIAAALVPGPVRTALSFAPIRALGLISYGVYLYHWPVFLWLTPERTGLDGVALFGERMAVTLALATVSYMWIEQPIRHGRRLSGWRPAAVAALVAATVAALFVNLPEVPSSSKIVFRAVNRPAAALAGLPDADADTSTLPLTGPAPDRGAAATTPTTAAPVPTAPAAPAALPPPAPPVQRIMLVGDSVAQTLGRGLERWGPAHGVRVMNAARFYCGIARGGRLAMTWGRTAKPCEDWGDRWPEALDRFRPDVVAVLSTIWDIGDRQRDEWGPDYLSVGDDRFDQFVIDEWRQAVTILGSRGARVVWLTSPCSSEDALTRNLQYSNGKYIPALLGSTPVVRLNFSANICPEGAFRNQLGPVAEGRPDGMHFSDAGADWIASWLGPQLANPYLHNTAVAETFRVRRF
jgi:peptidoglycan/LPS O-acetylase OafA/YrhL